MNSNIGKHIFLVLYSIMGEKIYLEARKENLENEIHQVLNQI